MTRCGPLPREWHIEVVLPSMHLLAENPLECVELRVALAALSTLPEASNAITFARLMYDFTESILRYRPRVKAWMHGSRERQEEEQYHRHDSFSLTFSIHNTAT